jgi:hypothetical protein
MTKKPTHKTVSFTPKGELAQLIWDYCIHSDKRYQLLVRNPQDVLRAALLAQDIIPKNQWGCGDSSNWEPGKAITVSLWPENAEALTLYAQERGIKKQDVMAAAVADYINQRPKEVTN